MVSEAPGLTEPSASQQSQHVAVVFQGLGRGASQNPDPLGRYEALRRPGFDRMAEVPKYHKSLNPLNLSFEPLYPEP